jgi:hypothetical protein
VQSSRKLNRAIAAGDPPPRRPLSGRSRRPYPHFDHAMTVPCAVILADPMTVPEIGLAADVRTIHGTVRGGWRPKFDAVRLLLAAFCLPWSTPDGRQPGGDDATLASRGPTR